MNRDHARAFWNALPCSDRLAVWAEGEKRYSWNDLRREIEQVRKRLGGPGQLVLMVASNHIDCLVHYLACLQSGNPLILVDHHVEAALIEEIVSHYRPSLLVRLQDGLPQWTPLPASGPAPHPDLALILPTSGSTGNAKMVMLSHGNLQANADSIVAYLELGSQERAITSLTFAYSFGLSVINSHLAVHGSLILTQRSLMERPFWELLRQCEATSLSGVPFTFEMMEKLGFRRMQLPSLRTLTQAGGRLGLPLAHTYAGYARETGRRFFIMYGQTEATARIAYFPAHSLPDKIGCIGRAIPGGTLLLQDEDGNRIDAPDTEGELVYEGANVMLGYALCREDLARPACPARLLTGDLARRDADGFYAITGRRNRFIKLQGRRLDLEALQTRMQEEGWNVWLTGDDARLIVIAGKGQDLVACRQRFLEPLRLHASLLKIIELESIPVTVTGKPDYATMKEKAHASAP